jgi:putative transposase
MVERDNPALPIAQQCRLLEVLRAAVYRKPAAVSAEDLAIMALIDRQYLARPYYGSRRMAAWLATQGHVVNRKRVQRLMRLLGLVAIYQCRGRFSGWRLPFRVSGRAGRKPLSRPSNS